MAATLLLDRTAWDLAIDAAGNIALATEPYAQVQDVASACRTFRGECWYDTTKGIPFLDKLRSVQIVQTYLEAAARTVPGVTSAQAVLSGLRGRTLAGQIQVTVAGGEVVGVVL